MPNVPCEECETQRYGKIRATTLPGLSQSQFRPTVPVQASEVLPSTLIKLPSFHTKYKVTYERLIPSNRQSLMQVLDSVALETETDF